MVLTRVFLSPSSRMDLDHRSNTAFDWDNYSRPSVHPEWMPRDWREIHLGHACYTPGTEMCDYRCGKRIHLGCACQLHVYLKVALGAVVRGEESKQGYGDAPLLLSRAANDDVDGQNWTGLLPALARSAISRVSSDCSGACAQLAQRLNSGN